MGTKRRITKEKSMKSQRGGMKMKKKKKNQRGGKRKGSKRG